MAENTKLMARVPIIPADFSNTSEHKVNELVMDFTQDDLYVKTPTGYVNITGQIKDEIKKIQDGSVVIHLVTEDTLPPIKDRLENHWYYVITRAMDASKDKEYNIDNYIYYGLIDRYSEEKNYVLIAQNTIIGKSVVKIKVVESYVPCFYVPVTMIPKFTNASTGEEIPYTIEDRLYALDATQSTYISYDVYILGITEPGEYMINVDIAGTDSFTITFDSTHDITGLVLPNDIIVKDGDSIGKALPDEPVKNDPRYMFQGWSTNNIAPEIVDETFKPESNTTLYAFYIYDSSRATYYSTLYSSVSGEVIGTYCSVASIGEIVTPKTVTGYAKPTGKTLEYDGQMLKFYYTPVEFQINYDLDGGSFKSTDNPKDKYTIEDDYTPPTPVYKNHYFTGWSPKKISKYTTGIVNFTAYWEDYAILKPGTQLNIAISELADLNSIYSIQRSNILPDNVQSVNVSCTTSPIRMWVSEGILMFYCQKTELWCNEDMTGAFMNMTILRDISALENFNTPKGMVVVDLFKNDTLLSNTSPVDDWAEGVFTNFRGAFVGTAAVEAERTPLWYRWNLIINYTSSTGKVIESIERSIIPDTILYSKVINGYTSVTQSLEINNPNISYSFIYNPISYQIVYETYGGALSNPKTSYTIEDETYYPPEPIREGYMFTGWNPECIHTGDYGKVTFIASYTGV